MIEFEFVSDGVWIGVEEIGFPQITTCVQHRLCFWGNTPPPSAPPDNAQEKAEFFSFFDYWAKDAYALAVPRVIRGVGVGYVQYISSL
jgi:hypothetical protein